MKIILKQDIKGVGRKYDVKKVADGYGANFLIPRKLAEYASPEAVKKAEILRSAALAEIEIKEKLTKEQIEILKGVTVTLNKKANEKGHFFEAVHKEEIAEALGQQAKIEIEADAIKLEHPIKEVGEHIVGIEIGGNKGEFKLHLQPF